MRRIIISSLPSRLDRELSSRCWGSEELTTASPRPEISGRKSTSLSLPTLLLLPGCLDEKFSGLLRDLERRPDPADSWLSSCSDKGMSLAKPPECISLKNRCSGGPAAVRIDRHMTNLRSVSTLTVGWGFHTTYCARMIGTTKLRVMSGPVNSGASAPSCAMEKMHTLSSVSQRVLRNQLYRLTSSGP